MIKISKESGKTTYGITEYVLDTEEDLNLLPPNEVMGSVALVISTGELYICNSAKKWVKL